MNDVLGEREKIRFNNYAGLWVNEQALAAGVLSVALMVTVGFYFSEVLTLSIDNLYTPLLAAVFAGAATGHYLGVASEKVGRASRSYLLGFNATLSAALVGVFQFSLLSLVLLITLATVFLVHNSGMGIQNRWIDRTMEVVAGKISVAGLASLGVYHFVFPAAVNFGFLLLYDFNLVSVV